MDHPLKVRDSLIHIYINTHMHTYNHKKSRRLRSGPEFEIFPYAVPTFCKKKKRSLQPTEK